MSLRSLAWFESIRPDPPARYREAVILEDLGRFDEAPQATIRLGGLKLE